MPKLTAGNDVKNWPHPTQEKVLKVCEEVSQKNGWMGKRDAAIIATTAMFGNRASENAILRRQHLEIGRDVIFVAFSILKIHHSKKVRCSCGKYAKFGWNNCPHCGHSLEGLEPLQSKEPQTVIEKQRNKNHPLAKFLIQWLDEVPADAWVFPKSSMPGIFGIESQPTWDERLSRQAVYNIIKKHTGNCWPHLFRHSLATGFARVGFSENDLMKWFGWTRYETAERYTRLGGGARIKSMGESNV